MAVTQCLVLIKPDGLVKSLTGNIISILSETKFKIVGAKIVHVSKELAESHYSELKDRLIEKHGKERGTHLFESTLKYIQGNFHTDRVMALVYEGEDAIERIRKLAGETNPEKANFTTIRGKYGRIHSVTEVFENVIHVSDSEKNAQKEIQLWFEPEELSNIIYSTKKTKKCMDKIVWA